MPSDVAEVALGVCTTPGCSGFYRGKSSMPSIRSYVHGRAVLSNQTAQQLCDAYIQNYLRTLQRTPSQRDIHYNGTIASVRDMCVFDVMFAGPNVSLFQNRKRIH